MVPLIICVRDIDVFTSIVGPLSARNAWDVRSSARTDHLVNTALPNCELKRAVQQEYAQQH